ncbi:unnamed protein product [Amoebophrya sp. A25]|nr:unnamed protein product [Amoebophrya sp. A25]|eukprot:GSA25T00021109001.1
MWMFGLVFSRYEYGAFLEDDLQLSPFLHQYFHLGVEVMQLDNSLAGASAWHDNQVDVPEDGFHVLRQNHFGGLGWLSSARVFRSYILPFVRSDAADKGWDRILSFQVDKLIVETAESLISSSANTASGSEGDSALYAKDIFQDSDFYTDERGYGEIKLDAKLLKLGAAVEKILRRRKARSTVEKDKKKDHEVRKNNDQKNKDVVEVATTGRQLPARQRLNFLYPSVGLTGHRTTSTHISGNDAEYRRLESLGMWPADRSIQWPAPENLTAWNYDSYVLGKQILRLESVDDAATPATSRSSAGSLLSCNSNEAPTTFSLDTSLWGSIKHAATYILILPKVFEYIFDALDGGGSSSRSKSKQTKGRDVEHSTTSADESTSSTSTFDNGDVDSFDVDTTKTQSPINANGKASQRPLLHAPGVVLHCLGDVMGDSDQFGWHYMEEKFGMVGRGWGETPRQGYKGTMLVYVKPDRHFVVARYSPYYELLCR